MWSRFSPARCAKAARRCAGVDAWPESAARSAAQICPCASIRIRWRRGRKSWGSARAHRTMSPSRMRKAGGAKRCEDGRNQSLDSASGNERGRLTMRCVPSSSEVVKRIRPLCVLAMSMALYVPIPVPYFFPHVA